MDSEYNSPITLLDTQTEKPFRIKHTIKNPNFFVIDKISNEYIVNHSKKYRVFLIKCDFNLIFNNDYLKPIHIEIEFYHNTSPINFKMYLLYQIDKFEEHEFSYIDEMNLRTVNDEMYMTYEHYLKYPMPSIELNLNIIFSKNPHLIKSPNRSHIHPLIRKYSHIL